jgi:hypothetical protein
MKLSSGQGWAIGAITLAILVACSPQQESPQPAPAPETPPAVIEPPTPAPAPVISETPADQPGYAGIWAFVDSECGDAAKTVRLNGRSISMAPGGKTCAVKSLEEEHPTGRSMTYHIKADCDGDAGVTEDMFTLNFGASDTVMQMKVNDREPTRLVRCPDPETP